jgi:hypothetical protein
VPVAVTLLSERPQAAMIARGEWPASFDPYKLDTELRSAIALAHGTYLDILPELTHVPNMERHFMPLDGHPDSEGHAMIAHLLAKELLKRALPELRAAAP